MYKRKDGQKPKRKPKVVRDMTKDEWEKANKDFFGENNADWLSEREQSEDMFEDEDGPRELDFDH